MNTDKLKKIVEGFLFASDKALTAEQIVKLFPEGEQPEKDDVSYCIDGLIEDFADHGIELKQVRSGYRFQVRQETASWVSRLWDEKPAKYTRAMLETLALIVYRQPITRGEIEEIRGVSVSSHIIKTMMERDWVKVIGHRDVPGRPALYASTKEFLDYFNLSSLEELPPLSEIKDLDSIATELDPEQNASLISAIREMQKENSETREGQETAAEEDESQQSLEMQDNKSNEETLETESTSEDETAIIATAALADEDEDQVDTLASNEEVEAVDEETEVENETPIQSEDSSNSSQEESQVSQKKSFSDLVSNFEKHQSEDEDADEKSEQDSEETWNKQDSSMETDPQ